MLVFSHTMMFELCLKLGLNCGKDSIEYNSVSVLSCVHCYGGHYNVKGFYSKKVGDKLVHTQFDLDL